MQHGITIQLDAPTLARLKELKLTIHRGTAAQEEMSGMVKRLAVEGGADLDMRADIRLVDDVLVILPAPTDTGSEPERGNCDGGE